MIPCLKLVGDSVSIIPCGTLLAVPLSFRDLGSIDLILRKRDCSGAHIHVPLRRTGQDGNAGEPQNTRRNWVQKYFLKKIKKKSCELSAQLERIRTTGVNCCNSSVDDPFFLCFRFTAPRFGLFCSTRASCTLRELNSFLEPAVGSGILQSQ